MAKLKTIDAICTSVQSMKKYVDDKLPNINIKQDVVKAFDVSGQLEEEWYPEFVTDTLGLIPNVEHKIIVSVDGVSYHGRFTPELYGPGYVGVVNFVEDGIENIFFDEVDDANDYFNYSVPRCLGFINLFDKMISGPNGEEVFDETKATIHFSVGEYEDGTIEKITGVEIFVPSEQNVLLTGEVVQQELDKKQDKLIYKESTAKSHKIEINGREGDVLIGETSPCYISESIGLIPDRYYTIKMKLYDLSASLPSLTSEEKPAKLYDIPMSIDANEASFEIDYENDLFIYRLPVESVSKDETGLDVDTLILSTYSGEDFSGLSIDFNIYDNLIVDEDGMPAYSENKSTFMLSGSYFSSLIEYVEIIPDVSSEDMVEVEVNNEFLETHRFITEEERMKWNEKQDSIPDAFYLRKIPQMDNSDRSARVIRDRVDLIRNMTDGLYVATYDIYFYGESTHTDITLEDGIEDVEFPIYKNDIIQFISFGDTVEFCGIYNYTSGKACVLDVDAGIVWIKSATGAYLGDMEEFFQYKCLEESVTYTKEQIYSTMIGGTSYKEYQFNVDFLLEEGKKYHIYYESLDGKTYEYEDVGQDDGEMSGKTVIKLYDNDFNVIVYTYESATEGHPSILKVKVYNSSGLNDFGKITICKVEHLSSEFFDKYRFVTQEEKQEWNEKQDKITYKSNETTIISLRNKVPLDGSLFIFDYPLGLVDGEQYSAKIKFAEGIFELEESALFNFLGLERVTDLNYEIKNNYMIFTDKFVAYSENGAMFLQVGNEETSYFMLVDGVGMNLETGDQYLTNDSSALFCLESFIKLIDYVEIIGPRQYEISENFFNTHELVSAFTQDDFDEMVGNIFGDQYKSKAFFTFIDSDAAPKEYKYPYIEEPCYAKELICNIYYDDGTVTTTPFWMMGGEDPGSNYSYVASVSPDNGGVSVMINNANDKNEWRIILDYDISSYFVMPEGMNKIEVVVIP